MQVADYMSSIFVKILSMSEYRYNHNQSYITTGHMETILMYKNKI